MKMRFVVAGALMVSLLAGCLNTDDAAGDATEVRDESALPGANGTLAPAVFAPPQVIGQAAGWGVGGEPSIAVADDGTLYISAPIIAPDDLARLFIGGGAQGHIWRSVDGGNAWTLLNDENGRLTSEGGGNGDTDVAVGPNGTVHLVDLGGGIPYRRSPDAGDSWEWGGTLNEDGGSVDRQWIDSHEDFVAVTWAAQDGDPGRGITFTASHDDGQTWSDPVDIVGGGMIQLGPVIIGPGGQTLLQPWVARDGYDLMVSRSTDAGATWHDVDTGYDVPEPTDTADQAWSPTVIFPVADFDAAGNALLAWAEYGAGGATRLKTMTSVDGGATWSGALAAGSGSGNTVVLPWVTGGTAGHFAVLWLESDQAADPDVGGHTWHLWSSVTHDALAPNATWAAGRVSEDPVHVGAICPRGGGCPLGPTVVYGDRTLLDFFESAATPDGDLVVTWTQTEATDGRNPQVRFARQVDGSRIA